MLKIAIVEDDKADRAALVRYVQTYGEENGETFSISTFGDGLSFLAACETGFNIVFMDIELPFLDGLKTVKKLRAVDQSASVIFVTNMAQYAVKGYEVDALDFVVKPVDRFNFYMKLEKAVRLQKKLSVGTIMLNTDDGMIKLELSDVLYAESSLHFVYYVTETARHRVRASMKETERRLEGFGFVRCGNSFLVNLRHVGRVHGDDVDIGGHTLPISRSRKKQFLDALAVYYGNGVR